MRKSLVGLLAASALTASVVGLAAGPALADPPAGSTIVAADLAGVGSDTTQAVFNQFSADYNVSNTPKMWSWDATGSTPITTKPGATSIARPNGSGQGILALENNTSATVDFARSSRGPQTGDATTDDFIEFAKDAVTWAGFTGGDAPSNLTTADLKAIYSCTITKWNQITDIPGFTGSANTIKAVLPQSSSGTRSFFLSAINGGVALTPGACVTTGPEENEGTDPTLNSPDVVYPYSVAHYIGQVYFGHTTATDAPGVLDVRSVDGIAPVDTVNKVINSSFAATSYGRKVYDVVRAADWNATDSHAAALKALFSSTGWICKNATAQADLKSFGFLADTTCGLISHS